MIARCEHGMESHADAAARALAPTLAEGQRLRVTWCYGETTEGVAHRPWWASDERPHLAIGGPVVARDGFGLVWVDHDGARLDPFVQRIEVLS